jgi:hypothetical protein
VDASTTLSYGISDGTVSGSTITKVGTYGTLSINSATGAYTYTPNNSAINALSTTATETYTISVSDGSLSTTTNYSMNLVGSNDLPINTIATDFHSSFTESNISDISALKLDIPNTSIASIILDTANDELDFRVTGRTDMWATRENAPFAWTETPDLPIGSKWSFETKVRIDGASEGTVVSGITFYDNNGGLPDFTFGINNWNGGYVHVQKLAGGRSGISDLSSPIITPINNTLSAFLKVEITENGMNDYYQFSYKLNEANSWIILNSNPISTYSYDRAALFYKTGEAKSGTSFDYIRLESGSVSTLEDTAKSIQGIQIADSDSTNVTVTFTHSAGTLSVATNVANGLIASAISGIGTATLILTGTVAQINATLAASSGLIYTPTANFNGNATLTMTTNDGVGGVDTDMLAMTVAAVNDIPVITSGSSGTVAENAATTAVIYTASVTDVDVSDTRTYSLKAATGDVSLLNINASTGAVTLNAPADYETKSSYTFTVIATDAGGLSAEQAVTVAVTNVNEAPVFTTTNLSTNYTPYER